MFVIVRLGGLVVPDSMFKQNKSSFPHEKVKFCISVAVNVSKNVEPGP